MNILRKIREQRLTDRAYSNGYAQGVFDTQMQMPGNATSHTCQGCEVCAIWDASTEALAADEDWA